MNKFIIYVGGAYGGKEENKQLIEDAIKRLKHNTSNVSNLLYGLGTSSPYVTYFSPVHSFGFSYNEEDYLEGVDDCLAMLEKCDALFLLDNWEESFGAKIEYGFAKAMGTPIRIIKTKEDK